MPTDRTVTRMSSYRVAMRPIVDRQTPVKTLAEALRIGNNNCSDDKLLTTVLVILTLLLHYL